MKTFAPRSLRGSDLRGLLLDLSMTPAAAAKFLQVTERSVFRWLADDSAPFAVLGLLWHESAPGRHTVALDLGNELNIQRGLSGALSDKSDKQARQIARLLSISDTGAANDPLIAGPLPLAGHQAINPVMRVPRSLSRLVSLDVQGGQVGTDAGIDAHAAPGHGQKLNNPFRH